MTPHLLSAFGRELSKIADAVIMQNSPDQAPSVASRAGYGAAGVAGAALAAKGGQYLGNKVQGRIIHHINDSLMNAADQVSTRHHESPHGVRGVVPGKRIGFGSPEEMKAIEDFRATNAPNARVFHGDEKGWRAFTGAPSTQQATASFHPESGAIYADIGAHPATLAHEVGHASGWQGLNRHAPLTEKLHALVSSAKAPGVVGALGTAGALGMAKTPEERDRNLRYARNATLATGALALPQLAEEARASINAVRMGRKAGRGLEYAKHLLPAFGTYAAKPLGAVAGTALGIEGLRRLLKYRNNGSTPSKQSAP